MDKVKLKSNLKIKLYEADMSQKELYEKLDVNKQTVHSWATGRVNPPLTTAFMLAKILNCKVNECYGQ